MKKLQSLLLLMLLGQPYLYAAKVLDINFDTNGNQIRFDSYTPYLPVSWGNARIYDKDIGDPIFPDTRPSMIGRGLHFDGLTHIETPDNNTIDFGSSSPFSISFWIKTSSNQSNNTVIDKRDRGGAGYHVTIYKGYLLFQLNNGSTHYNFWTTSTTKLNDNKWHHVTITTQRNHSSGIKFFIDGSLAATFNSGLVTGSISNAGQLLIGGHSESGSYRFNGDLDEVAIYNHIIPDTDVTAQHRVAPFAGTIEAEWHKAIPSIHRSGRYARYFTFTVPKASSYTIDLESSTDTYLYLLRGNTMNGSTIRYDDDGGAGYNSRIIQTLQPGTYTIEATTYSSAQLDNFTLSCSSTYPVFSEIAIGDINVTLKHLMYKKNKLFNNWETNTSFEGYEHLSRNDRNEHVFAAQPWLPDPTKVKNIVFLVAGQQGIRADRQDYPAIVTGQKEDWHYDSSFNWINTWKYTKNRSYNISGRSVAGQIIADYQNNSGRYFGFSPNDTALILLFDACFYVEEANGNGAIVQGIVDEYTNWIMSKTSINPENIYLAGASRGGSLVTQMAYNLKHKPSWQQRTANTKIIVSCFDGVANHEQGELWTNSNRVDNPLEWINTRFCYDSNLSNGGNFRNIDNLRLLQITGGADVFTGTPWHAFYFDSIPGLLEHQWVDRSHKDIGRNWHDNTVVEHLRWLNHHLHN